MRLLFLRHANSAFNRDKIYQGQYDCDLSEKGIEDLKAFQKTFNKKYDYCYSSPLKRAKYTAFAITDKEKIIYDDRLKEIGLGVWETTPITKEKKQQYKNGFIPEDAETKQEFAERIILFLEELIKKHEETDTILIVTHEGVIKAIERIFKIKSNNILEILICLK